MKIFRVYRLYIAAVVLMFFLVHTPFGIAVSNGMGKKMIFKPIAVDAVPEEEAASSVKYMYDSMQLSSIGLSQEAFEYAIKGYTYLKNKGKLLNERTLSIIDFTKPSFQKRS